MTETTLSQSTNVRGQVDIQLNSALRDEDESHDANHRDLSDHSAFRQDLRVYYGYTWVFTRGFLDSQLYTTWANMHYGSARGVIPCQPTRSELRL